MKRKSKDVTPAALPDGGMEAAIAARAYSIWEAEGRPSDGELRHWLQAEEEVRRAQTGPDGGEG